MISDWNHWNKARSGDSISSEIIFIKYSKSLIRMTSLITGSIDSAKDVVQETFVKLFSGKIKHQDGNFKTYITTIAYRLALKEKYRKQRFQNVENISIIDNLSSPIENQIKNENQKFIFNAITSLPKHQREILILRFYGEHSYEEIAKITELPLGTVKSRIFYAVKTCRSKLKEMGVFG